MRRLLIVGWVVVVVCGGLWGRSAAQGNWTPEQQAALDQVAAALTSFHALDRYTAQTTQQLDQALQMSFQDQTVTLTQNVQAQGEVGLVRSPGQRFDDRDARLTQTVTQTLTGAGDPQQTTVGPTTYHVILAGDRIYLQVEVPAELQNAMPQGWYDVTNGATMFLGMDMLDMTKLAELGSGTLVEGLNAAGQDGPDYGDLLLEAVSGVEVLPPDTVEGRSLTHIRLTLDPQKALESIGAENLTAIFNTNALPFDVTKLIDLIYHDPDTRYTVDLRLGAEDGMLYDYTEQVTLNLEIGPELITDPSLQGATVALQQTQTQSLLLTGINEPLEITAPALAQ